MLTERTVPTGEELDHAWGTLSALHAFRRFLADLTAAALIDSQSQEFFVHNLATHKKGRQTMTTVNI
jgi:hypothetical protein